MQQSASAFCFFRAKNIIATFRFVMTDCENVILEKPSRKGDEKNIIINQ